MRVKRVFALLSVLVLLGQAVAVNAAEKPRTGGSAVPPRPEGPCDVYTAAGCPCAAGHSTTRALYAAYDGPLYRVMRQSDGKCLDIGVVKPSAGDAGGYADAARQDAFCSNTVCWITTVYDQSGNGNHLVQAPRGGFSGPAMGGFNNVPVADMAPVTVMGHKVYGVLIEPGMGLRWNDARGTAVDDQAEGQYWVVDGSHYNSGCCFDYGNAETDSRDDGDGTMETTYFGNATWWYHGQAPGPWVMTDQENNLVGCVNPSPDDKFCADLPSVPWRFVTAMADGEPHHWRSMGGDAQRGGLRVMFDGTRVINDRSSYDPMRKQGAILLGNGGDNSNGSQGTFYEGAMTAGGTFPTRETDEKVQANVAAARYDARRLAIAPASAVEAPPGLQTFTPRSSKNVTVTFTNTTGAAVTGLALGVSAPRGWKSTVLSSEEKTWKYAGPVAPGAVVEATFQVTSGTQPFNGDLTARASWTNVADGRRESETAVEKARCAEAVRINEFRITAGSPDNSTDSFIELFNSGDGAVDLSGWSLTHHSIQEAVFSSIRIPDGTKIAARGFHLLGLSNSGLAVPAKKGESNLFVRTAAGMSAGDAVEIGTGSSAEKRTIAAIRVPPPAPAGRGGFNWRGEVRGQTTVWQPLPDGPVITIPAGSTRVPVTSVAGFEAGMKMAIGTGADYPATSRTVERYEVVTITDVGKAGTQAWLSMDAKAGDRNIKVSSVENISVGDKIRLDIASPGHGIETVTVTAVGSASSRTTFNGPLTEKDDPGTGLDLAEPLKYDHSSNIPFSARGTGIGFEPATVFGHSSNEPVLALGTVVTLDRPLAADHGINAVVRDAKAAAAGYRGTPAPDQWFGGPVLGTRGGAMVLRDAAGRVVDSQNYGGLIDPWAAEGYQAVSGADANGCFAPAPVGGRGRFAFFGAAAAGAGDPDLSAGRFPDGLDTDSNCSDFRVQSSAALAAASAAGADNLKVSAVEGFAAGQTVVIGRGDSRETAVVAEVGTAGGTTAIAAADAGATALTVAGIEGFAAGQAVTVGAGDSRETAVVASFTRGRRAFGDMKAVDATVTFGAPLAFAHAAGDPVSGSGVTLSGPLARTHEAGTPVANGAPTPGGPNRYYR
jgi:non-reducing end alpha-L-arabinofuranosidase